MTDLEIAHPVSPRPIEQIGAMLGLRPEDLIRYGPWKAKVAPLALERLADRPLGRYVLVTAINPTPLGEGKTTTSIGLAMALSRLGRRAVVTLRQPSLGPVFGIKGGGTGGGRAQVIPMEDINLHFTGDAHAVASAHNLLSAFLDNHLFQGNSLNLDPAKIAWPRAMGISDRALRQVHLGGTEGRPGRDGEFVLTEASEIMAILALVSGAKDLRRRLGRILVGFTKEGRPVTAEELKCTGAMAVLLRDALCPNLVQTIEGTPALVHTGPFGNIAHGNSSILADQLALRTAEYVVTEAGFGSDLGAEKFFNIKCRTSGLRPAAAVVVATLRALKLHGGGGVVKAGVPLPGGLTGPNREALTRGLANLEQHLANVRTFGVPAVVAINAFKDDPADELQYVRNWALSVGAVGSAVSTHFMDGGRGAMELAKTVEAACQAPSAYQPLYQDDAPIKEKIETVARRIYGAAAVSYEPQAEAQIEQAVRLGFGEFPVCMAKTPLSLSHDAQLKGRPTGFTLPIKELRILAGAGFLTAVCSGIQLMPGLPKQPAGERMDLDPETGEIVGLS
ncbi:MAG: formate--tetrahydrofolate ligase [Nitrospirae bacterium]|nr:MAG: formate--tetrahydrofolate ligase [Nitrospirota bacterium]